MSDPTSPSPEPSSAPTSPANGGSVTIANRVRNFLVVLVASLLGVAIFLGVQTQAGVPSLSAQAEAAMPWDVAQSNGKPTLMEFYANWCTSCQAMAPDLAELKQSYGDRINFVMLNIDNDKWLPEMLEYRVDGIPHFVFMDDTAQPIVSIIGEQPRPILAANLDALASGTPLPFAPNRGQLSPTQLEPTITPNTDDPRSHGAQVVPSGT
ncbi:thioredoxin family protein [Vacuolonema iberomarrocanum]|uniref:thioredoxin family protein n=1 Tax=Vacuolonema iberomarrocanum TaxID=3454632 RepID=UPI001A02CE58|nr:thioredoxin family protein [filamentous cyanobacterium LEGE 07170]